MLLHHLNYFEIENYYQNGSRFKGVYSRNSLPNIKDGAYVINLNECEWIGTHWAALYVNGDNVTYFDRFGVEYFSKGIFFKKNVTTNIYKKARKWFNNVWILLYWNY